MASPSSLKVGELSPLDGIASLSFPIGSVPRFGRIYFRIFFLFRSKSGSAPFSSWLFSFRLRMLNPPSQTSPSLSHGLLASPHSVGRSDGDRGALLRFSPAFP